jgi:DNA-binding MarR family transcriptional regulator
MTRATSVTASCPTRASARRTVTRQDLGFGLAKASQRWNELLAESFRSAGFGEVRPSYGSVLVPLFEEDGLRMGELARRVRLAKQTMTTMVRLVERAGLVVRRRDPHDARATCVHLTERGRLLEPIAASAVGALETRIEDRLGPRRTASLRAALAEIADL